MNAGEIFLYSNSREIIVAIFQEMKHRNPSFSVRAWSKRLGYKNPSYLHDVLRDNRSLKPDLAKRISDTLDLPEKDKTYFETLVFHENARTPVEKEYFQRLLNNLNPKEDSIELLQDIIPNLAYHAIDEMVCLKDFREDVKYLTKRLGPDATFDAMEVAFQNLFKLESIKRGKDGRLQKLKALRFNRNLPSNIWKNYRRTLLNRTLTAFDEQTDEETYFEFTPFPIKRSMVPKIKESLKKWIFDMHDKLEVTKDADEVYELNLNFYRLTFGEPEITATQGPKSKQVR